MLSFEYRLNPNRIQREALDSAIGLCRSLYNNALEERISFYKRYGKSRSYYDQCKEIAGITAILPEFLTVYSQTRQHVLKKLKFSFDNFFRRHKSGAEAPGFPRFKGYNRFNSIYFPQVKYDLSGGGVKISDSTKTVKVFGIQGDVRIVYHRPFQGRCKTATIKRKAGHYYLILACDEVPKAPIAMTGKVVGIDLGISSFITKDDGTKIHHPRPYKTAKEKLAARQRKLALKKLGSNNRSKAVLSLQRAHEKVRNVRKGFQHKTANKLIKEYDTIFCEDLNVKGMLEAKGFEVSKSNISDASWGSFASLLEYKAENAGKRVIKIDPKNTSKTCFYCLNIKGDLSLRDREYCCDNCGWHSDRDRNAAMNIKRLGRDFVEKQRLGTSHCNVAA